MRLVHLAVPLSLVSCASLNPPPQKVVLQQAMDITNVIPFDLAACGPRPLPMTPVTTDTVIGAVLSTGPAVEECFADPASRDGQPLDLTATVTVLDTGVTVAVEGTGATAAGIDCAKAAISALPWKPVPEGAQGVASKVKLAILIPQVKLGDNPANDLVGRLRLAQRSACECYAPVREGAPPVLTAEVTVQPEGEYSIEFPDSPAPAVTDCLVPKFKAVTPGELSAKLKWPLLLKNSYTAAMNPGAPPALRFQQLEGYRDQLTADVLLASGRRAAAGAAYEKTAMAFYNTANTSKASKEPVRKACEDVVAADEAQRAAMESLVKVLEQSITFAREQKASSKQFVEIEQDLVPQLGPQKEELARLERQKADDTKACAAVDAPPPGKAPAKKK